MNDTKYVCAIDCKWLHTLNKQTQFGVIIESAKPIVLLLWFQTHKIEVPDIVWLILEKMNIELPAEKYDLDKELLDWLTYMEEEQNRHEYQATGVL